MESYKYSVSAETLFLKPAREMHASDVVDRVNFACLYRVEDILGRAGKMKLEEGDEHPVLHIPANRMGDPYELLYRLQSLGVNKILLLRGSPAYMTDAARNLKNMIRLFSDSGIEVHVGSYVDDYWFRNSDDQRDKQMDILDDKFSLGASRVVTQPSFSIEAMDSWMEAYARRGFNNPVSLGVAPKGNVFAILKTIRSRLNRFKFNNNKVEIDFVLRLFASIGCDPKKLIAQVHERELLLVERGDGFHLTAVPGSDQIALAEFIKGLE